MQIHELNTYSGNLDSGAFIAIDNGSDTGKKPVTALTDPLNARIDNIISSPSPSAAEVQDARQAADGVIYDTLGNAIRGQVGDLQDEIDAIYTEEVTSTNIMDPSVYETGAIGSDGSLMTNGVYANYRTSGFIPLEYNEDYYFAVYSTSPPPEASNQRKCLLLYDEDKQPINGTHQNTDGVAQLTFNTSSTAKYVRVSSSATTQLLYEHFQVAKGTTAGNWVAYSAIKKLNINLGDVPTEQVQQIVETSGAILEVDGKNLVDPSKLTVGGLQSDGSLSISGSWANYSTSDFIEIEENTDYVFSTYNSSGGETTTRKIMNFYDANKEVISGMRVNSEGNYYETYNSANAKYVRVCSQTTLDFMFEVGTVNSGYEPYTLVMNKPLGAVPMAQAQNGNVLYGKKWAVCGDSFTNGATATLIDEYGPYYGKSKVYPYLIGQRNNMDIVKFFAGGQTLAYPSDGTFTNSLTYSSGANYSQNIPADVDYITFYLGINDNNHNTDPQLAHIDLGTIDDNTVNTYYGAWNVVLTWLITNRPFAHIGMIISNGMQSEAWMNAQINIAKKYGIPYINMNGDSRTPVMIRSQNPDVAAAVKSAVTQKQAVNYPSNTHPNDDTHVFESTFIEDFLRSI